MSERPLSRLRVVEIGQYVAAPFAATLLADHGAEVVKVERPGGDPYRSDPALFAAWNCAKTSVTLDLRTPDGLAEAERLVGGADVVIENLRPGALDSLGLSFAASRATNPRLVTCSISGYGTSGPARDDPGWEPLVHAHAGAQQGLFTSDQPMWLPFPMASVAAALFAVLGVSAALLKRETTGYGQHVETSLFEALLFLNAGPIFHRARRRLGVAPPARTPVLHTYETSDGRGIQVNLSGTERWRELCRLVELDDDGGLDFADPASLAKLSDREWLKHMLGELTRRFGARTADEWEQALLRTPAAAAKCNTLEEWLDHEQARANDVFADVDDPALGPAASRRLTDPASDERTRARSAASPRIRGWRTRGPPGRRPLELLGRAALRPSARRARCRRGQGRAARRRGRLPAHAGSPEHLRRRQPLQARTRHGRPGSRGPRSVARPRRRRRRRRRERGSRQVGAARPRRRRPSRYESRARVPRREGLRSVRTDGVPTVLRLRHAGRDRDGDDTGRWSRAADELHGERLLHRHPSGRRRGDRTARPRTWSIGAIGRPRP